uniref:Hsp90 co-chaperone Cdc37 n=1 Tax=Xiphophorus maculatus TaxID=8083 RepID=A0A3B5R1Q7_XIPMA
MLTTLMRIDCGVWDHIYVSHDDDVTSPFVDTPSSFRMRHRVSRDSGCSSCEVWSRRTGSPATTRTPGRADEEEDEEPEAELKKVQAEVKKLEKNEKFFLRHLEEHRRGEKKLEKVLARKGRGKDHISVQPEIKKETQQKHKTFVEKYAKEMKHFGMLRRWDDSQKYLSDNPHLVCEESANDLVVLCIDFEMDEVRAVERV